MSSGRISGVDGCRSDQWLCLAETTDTRVVSASVHTTPDLFDATRDHAVVAIDIPIGLTDAGPRDCDREARRLLGPRASSVFPAPVRAALAAESYRDACERSAAAHGKRLSRQAFGILPRIRDVDVQMRADPTARDRVSEAHPELCFRQWNDERPMAHAKRTPEGFGERRALVARDFGAHAYDEVRVCFRRTLVADDDILDAFATLWTARRIREERATATHHSDLSSSATSVSVPNS